MRDFIKPAIFIAVVFAIGVVLIHDLGGVMFGYLRVEGATQKVAEESARVYRATGDKIAASRAAVSAGKEENVEVYGWELKGNNLTVWTRVQPRKTLVLRYLISDFETKTAAQSQYTELLK